MFVAGSFVVNWCLDHVWSFFLVTVIEQAVGNSSLIRIERRAALGLTVKFIRMTSWTFVVRKPVTGETVATGKESEGIASR